MFGLKCSALSTCDTHYVLVNINQGENYCCFKLVAVSLLMILEFLTLILYFKKTQFESNLFDTIFDIKGIKKYM